VQPSNQLGPACVGETKHEIIISRISLHLIPLFLVRMELSTLTAISPVDGRYWAQLSKLAPFYSEFSLMRYRVLVEVEYFLALCDVLDALKTFKQDPQNVVKLRALYDPANFGLAQAEKVKAIEKVTNHDVKAIEYFIKEKFDENNWQSYKEYVHFALTSQDINNTAIPLAIKVRNYWCWFFFKNLPLIEDEMDRSHWVFTGQT